MLHSVCWRPSYCMNRRTFLSGIIAGGGVRYFSSTPPGLTKHLIWIVNGGVRKRDYYENESLSPNIRRLAREGFVFEEDHCERVASHGAAFAELLQGREFSESQRPYPTLLDYVGDGLQVDSLRKVPPVLEQRQPRIIVCREDQHDIGHQNYEKYLLGVQSTDLAIGRIFDWIKAHPYFSQNTAIVIPPEFGRDDEVNDHGHLHHSYGFYYTHRVASVFWGPDFNQGIDKKTVIRSVDMAPTLARVFGVKATYAEGRVVPGLFKPEALSS